MLLRNTKAKFHKNLSKCFGFMKKMLSKGNVMECNSVRGNYKIYFKN